jgi:L,D-transpeptidase YcbB
MIGMRRRLLGLLCVVLVFSPPVRSDALLKPTLDAFRDARTIVLEGVPLLSGRLLAEFYAGRGDDLVWDEPARMTGLLDLVERSTSDGFRPEDFHAEHLRRLAAPGVLAALPRVERISADILFSDALARYLHHHYYGKLDPVALDSKWHDRSPASGERLLAEMNAALDGAEIAVVAERFPRPFWYGDLRRALHRFAARPALAGLPPLPAGTNLARGNRHPRVTMLRERLALIDGAARSDGAVSEVFDDQLHDAVVAFQRRSGLATDGVVGPSTLAALNGHGDETRAEQIRINLERMRWLYQDLPEDYVFVDVAAFKVHLVREGAFAWSTPVIVGTAETQTPMFRDTMDHLVFNPTWTVPASIQKKMGRVSGDYRLVDRRTGKRVGGGDARDHRRYRLVQEPGPKNALGRVKFMFPNRHAVYLHDTPGKSAFGRQVRTLSNGCVRVQDPLDLAEALLEGSNWDRSGIDRLVERGQTRYVDLADTLPVLLYYLTAFADGEGRVGFRGDVYRRDDALREALSAPVLRTRIAFPEPVQPVGDQPGPEQPPAPETPEGQDTGTSVRLTLQESAAPPSAEDPSHTDGGG